jgi:hypothetical protein
MCDKRTFNRELDLKSGQWEEAIRRDERQKVLELIDKYFRTKGFNSTDKEADSFAQFVVEVIREELRQQIKEMK